MRNRAQLDRIRCVCTFEIIRVLAQELLWLYKHEGTIDKTTTDFMSHGQLTA